jgi:xanthine dehydrogenase YagS FAD-binding subunit
MSEVQASAGWSTRFLAGGTTLADMIDLEAAPPRKLVDISALPELKGFNVSGEDELVFGALARMGDVGRDPVLLAEYPALGEALLKGSSPQLRQVATVGGNLLQQTRCPYFRAKINACNKRNLGSGCAAVEGENQDYHALLGGSQACIATYPGDWAVALAIFDTRIDTLSPRGARTISLSSLYHVPETSLQETILKSDELIIRIRVPLNKFGKASGFQKIRHRETYGFAMASSAVGLSMDGVLVSEARIALGGLSAKPWRAKAAEESLAGVELTDEIAARAGELALRDANPGRHNAFKIKHGIEVVRRALIAARDRTIK